VKDILLTGCSIFIDDYLNDLIEESGGNVVYFDTWVGESYFSQIFEEESWDLYEDPLDLLVYRYKNNISGDHTVPNSLENKVALIMRKVKEHKQKTGKKLGIINHIIKFCDHMSLQQSNLKNKIQENEIAVLNLERDYSRANRGQLSTRIEAYMEMIEK
jgi:benzoyl-CoA reductase/2-hydroxyglutaryl-CoA dehydratase subunit BcrC/BadD/HgdB